MSEHVYDSIVVGVGIAGMTATTYLARAGPEVAMPPPRPMPGGGSESPAPCNPESPFEEDRAGCKR